VPSSDLDGVGVDGVPDGDDDSTDDPGDDTGVLVVDDMYRLGGGRARPPGPATFPGPNTAWVWAFWVVWGLTRTDMRVVELDAELIDERRKEMKL